MRKFYEAKTGKLQADSAVSNTFTIPTFTIEKETPSRWELKLSKGAATTGTVAITVLTTGTTYEPLVDSFGAAITFAVSSNASTYRFECDGLRAVLLTPTSINAGYNAYLEGY